MSRESPTTLPPIPSGWRWSRISWLFNSTGSGTTPAQGDIVEPGPNNIPWVTTGELREQRITSTQSAIPAETVSNYSALKVHPAGSLVLAMYGATIGRMALLEIPATTNQACCVLSEPIGATSEFVQYSLLANRSRLILDAAGGGQPNINQDKVRSLRIAVPPIDVQCAIADYLDRETARIDTLIEEQQRLTDLVLERRRAIRTETALKGTRAADTVASHLPWVDRLPADWNAVPLTSVARLESGHTPSRTREDWWQDCYIPWISLNDGPYPRVLDTLNPGMFLGEAR